MHDIKVAAGIEEKHPVDQACEDACPKMTVRQRTIGYVVTFGVGSVLNIMSWSALVRNGTFLPIQLFLLYCLTQ